MKSGPLETMRIASMKLVVGQSAQMFLELLLRMRAGGEDMDTGRVVRSRVPLATLVLDVATTDTVSWQPHRMPEFRPAHK